MSQEISKETRDIIEKEAHGKFQAWTELEPAQMVSEIELVEKQREAFISGAMLYAKGYEHQTQIAIDNKIAYEGQLRVNNELRDSVDYFRNAEFKARDERDDLTSKNNSLKEKTDLAEQIIVRYGELLGSLSDAKLEYSKQAKAAVHVGALQSMLDRYKSL